MRQFYRLSQERTYVERERRTLKPTELGTVVRDMLVKHFPDIIKTEFTAAMEEDLDAISRGEKQWTPVLEEFYGGFSAALDKADQEAERVQRPVVETGEMCELCGKPLLLREGRFGKFIGCSGFPQCRNTKQYLDTIGVKCPQCEHGDVVRKRNRRGNVFYSCSRYPDCEYASSRPPPAARAETASEAPVKETAEVGGD